MIELLNPNDAVDEDGNPVPRDDVPEYQQFQDIPEGVDFRGVIDRDEERLISLALTEGAYPTEAQNRIRSVLTALQDTRTSSPCRFTADGTPIAAHLGYLEEHYKVDPYVVAILRARVAEHNRPFLDKHPKRLGETAVAPTLKVEDVEREPDWAERAAGEGVYRRVSSYNDNELEEY